MATAAGHTDTRLVRHVPEDYYASRTGDTPRGRDVTPFSISCTGTAARPGIRQLTLLRHSSRAVIIITSLHMVLSCLCYDSFRNEDIGQPLLRAGCQVAWHWAALICGVETLHVLARHQLQLQASLPACAMRHALQCMKHERLSTSSSLLLSNSPCGSSCSARICSCLDLCTGCRT